MFACAKLLLLTSVSVVALSGPPTFDDLHALDATSEPVRAEDFEKLNFGTSWSCGARSRVVRPAIDYRYYLRFSRGDGDPRGRFLQSSLDSTYVIENGELTRVRAGAPLERGHRNQPYDEYELQRDATRDITTIPHSEVVRFTNDKTNLLIRVNFNPKFGEDIPQAYLVCKPN